MDDLKIRSDSVNVEHIMQQIRARIREKRGADYTEQQIRDLAAEAFARFLDPRGERPGLLEQYRRGRVPPVENYVFEDTTLFESSRGALQWIRRLLRPILKLLFNPNPLIHVLHLQSGINARHAQSAAISYDLLYNLVLEMTRLSVEVKTLGMRVESTASRVDFAERRALASRGQRRGEDVESAPATHARGSQAQAARGPAAHPQAGPPPAGQDTEQGGSADARRKKRRRRGRRGGANRAAGEVGQAVADADAGGVDTAPGGAERATEAHTDRDESIGQADATPAPLPSDREDQ